MKKAKPAEIADEPMGIVIAMGNRVQSIPLVRAYYWCSDEFSVAERSESGSRVAKA